jgi:uncharacterized protein (DUF433 family)
MTEQRPHEKVFGQLRFAIPDRADQIDWTGCPEVDRDPGKCSGAWCVKGTRIMVQGIFDNAKDFTAEQIAGEIFEGITADQVRRIFAFVRQEPPPLMWGEGEPTALLLGMVLHHCSTAQQGELDSHGIAANAEAMLMLDDCAYIEITHHAGHHITAKVRRRTAERCSTAYAPSSSSAPRHDRPGSLALPRFRSIRLRSARLPD